jgi:hypothetical protein
VKSSHFLKNKNFLNAKSQAGFFIGKNQLEDGGGTQTGDKGFVDLR